MSNWKCGNVNISIWSSLHSKDKDYPGHGSMVVKIYIYLCMQSILIIAEVMSSTSTCGDVH